MHLQHTKRASARTGGPQYYFHSLPGYVLSYLRQEGAVRVALVRPYGATKSDFFALGKDHKKGFDCAASTFQFLDLEPYAVPVEVKKKSAGFHYQEAKYGKDELSRAVILCMVHNKATLLTTST